MLRYVEIERRAVICPVPEEWVEAPAAEVLVEDSVAREAVSEAFEARVVRAVRICRPRPRI